MDSNGEDMTHGSSPKRIKLDLGSSNTSGLCGEDRFSCVSSPIRRQNDHSEAISSGDCDSGYEASTMESMPTPSHQLYSPSSTPGCEPNPPCYPPNHTPPPTLPTLPVATQHQLLGNSEDHLPLNTSANVDGVIREAATERPDDGDDRMGGNEADDDEEDEDEEDGEGAEEGDEEDNASTVSELSGLSDLSVHDWKVMAGSMTWIQKQMHEGADPRELLTQLGVSYEPHNLDDVTLWKIIINVMAEPPRRHKLRHVNTIDDVVRLLKGAKNMIVLTGAGVSVSCGIPDFRSRDGIYSRLAIDFPDLPDPQAMFDITYFSHDPRPFFKFARDIYPGKFKPSPCHRFIKSLENHNKLLRNYTQNIDTLEKVADINRVIECHGSFATATCTKCSYKVAADSIREAVLAQNIPLCEKCRPDVIPPSIPIVELNDKQPEELKDLVANGIMKPDIVFFGEGLPDSFHNAMTLDKNECDLLLVIGSSLKVRPVARIPSCLPAEVPQILINREPLPHCHFDVELLGDCDVIIGHICEILGGDWPVCITSHTPLTEVTELLPWKTSVEDLTSLERTQPVPIVEPTAIPPLEPPSCDDRLKPEMCTCAPPTENSTNIPDEQSVNTMCSKCEKNKLLTEDSLSSIKERHMSIDSARDSGIGENSNFTDFELAKFEEETTAHEAQRKSESNNAEPTTGFNAAEFDRLEDLRGYWQPKQQRCILERLPKDSFFLVPPSRYIFPGTELFYDPDEKIKNVDKSSSSESSSDDDSDSDPAI